MLLAFPEQYSKENYKAPTVSTVKAVLGNSHHNPKQYSLKERKLFNTYHKRFKLGSKPTAHIDALAQISDKNLLSNMPKSFGRLADAVIAKLAELPE